MIDAIGTVYNLVDIPRKKIDTVETLVISAPLNPAGDQALGYINSILLIS